MKWFFSDNEMTFLMFMLKLEFIIPRRIDLCELQATSMDSRLNELRNVDLRNKVCVIKE